MQPESINVANFNTEKSRISKFAKSLINIFSIVGALGSVLALVLSSIQLGTIRDLIPTRTIPSFPGNMCYINDVLEKAQRNEKVDSIIIFTDVTAYGFLSQPKEWIRYRDNIEELIRKKKVYMICYNHKLAMEFVEWQLEECKNDTTKCKALINRAKRNFESVENKLEKTALNIDEFNEIKTYSQLISFIDDYLNKDYIYYKSLSEDPQRYKDKLVFKEVENPCNFYMWHIGGVNLIHENSAIISFPVHKNENSTKQESGFFTKDPEILEIFVDLQNSVKDNKLFYRSK